MTRSEIFKAYTRLQKRILKLQEDLLFIQMECTHPFREKIGLTNSRCADCGLVE